jgi:hypothetical protein
MDAPPRQDAVVRRNRVTGLLLGALAVALMAIGGRMFLRAERQLSHDPGRSSRTPEVLDKMLKRAEQAEIAGDRGAAIAAYRFVVAVGAAGDPEIEPYIAAANRGLARLGAAAKAP